MSFLENTNICVHVPHASTAIPDELRSDFLVKQDELDAEARISADLYSDLLAKEAWQNAHIVDAKVSRIVVDVERYPDDAKEEMSKVGRGAIYECDHKGQRIRDVITNDKRAKLLNDFYYPHWERLRAAAKDKILIDLHTYPLKPWVVELHSSGVRPEIDIGFSEGLTPMRWVNNLTAHFKYMGYTVGHNTPYVGVIDAGANASVMIEIRRDIVGMPGADPVWQRLVNALSKMPMG